MAEQIAAWGEVWLWVGGSLLLAVLWANLAWFFCQPRPGAIGEFVARLAAWRFSPSLFQFLRLLYYVGVPFAALVWGHDVVIGRWLGLQRFNLPTANGDVSVAANWLDWAYDVGWMVGLGVGAWTLLALGWWSYRRAVVSVGEGEVVAGADRSAWVFLREAAYHEVHWAFYRNGAIVALQQHGEGKYWGTWIGLALVAVEAMLNPAWRNGLTDPRQGPAQLMRAALAVVSSVLFLHTENLWLALLLHWGVSACLSALVRALPSLPLRQTDRAAI